MYNNNSNRPRQLQAVQSLQMTLARANVATDLSWLEDARALSRTKKDAQVQNDIALTLPPVRDSQPLERRGASSHQSPLADKEKEVAATAVAAAAAKPSETTTSPKTSARALVSPVVFFSVDARFVPACATVSIGAFTVVCLDDVGRSINEDAIDRRSCPSSLGKLEISGVGSGCPAGVPGAVEPADAAAASGHPGAIGELDKDVFFGNAATICWATLTPASSSDTPTSAVNRLLPPKIKLALTGMAKPDERNGTGLVPTGARASAHLGEVRIRCRIPEMTNETMPTAVPSPTSAASAKAQDGTPISPSTPGLKLKKISVVPTIVVLLQRPICATQEKAPTPSPPASTSKEQPRSTTGSSSDRSGGSGSGDINQHSGLDGSASVREKGVPRTGLRQPPPLPPRSRTPSTSTTFNSKVPEVKVEVDTVTGSVDAGLAGWLNLRGRWEAEDLAATKRRAEQLIAGERCSTFVGKVVLYR